MVAYLWAAPTSLVGLVLAALGSYRARAAVVDGVLEIHGPAIAWALANLTPWCGGAAAITFGHVVLARDPEALDDTRAHERVHVGQYERWGPFFIPAYLASSAWARLRGGHTYYDNIFERDAFANERYAASARTGRAPASALGWRPAETARRSAANARAKFRA